MRAGPRPTKGGGRQNSSNAGRVSRIIVTKVKEIVFTRKRPHRGDQDLVAFRHGASPHQGRARGMIVLSIMSTIPNHVPWHFSGSVMAPSSKWPSTSDDDGQFSLIDEFERPLGRRAQNFVAIQPRCRNAARAHRAGTFFVILFKGESLKGLPIAARHPGAVDRRQPGRRAPGDRRSGH